MNVVLAGIAGLALVTGIALFAEIVSLRIALEKIAKSIEQMNIKPKA